MVNRMQPIDLRIEHTLHGWGAEVVIASRHRTKYYNADVSRRTRARVRLRAADVAATEDVAPRSSRL